jgi:hypothetical protein
MKCGYVTFSSSTIREVGVEICIIGQTAMTDVRLVFLIQGMLRQDEFKEVYKRAPLQRTIDVKTICPRTARDLST